MNFILTLAGLLIFKFLRFPVKGKNLVTIYSSENGRKLYY